MSRWSAWRSGQPSGRASEAVYAEERRSFFDMFFGSLVPGSLGNSDGISNIKPSRILYQQPGQRKGGNLLLFALDPLFACSCFSLDSRFSKSLVTD